MLQNITFIVFFLLFMTGVALVKQSDERTSFVVTLIVSIWTSVMVGAVCAYVMNCLGILVNVKNMAVAFGLCGGGVFGYLLISKKIQKFSFQVSELCGLFFCIALWGYTFLKTFGLDLSIAYGNIDAGIHFDMAYDIFRSQRLTNPMYFASMYNSLIMEMLQPFLMKETIYKAFVLADAIFNLMNLLMFWVVALQFAKSRFSRVAVYVIVLFYFVGWPLWSWIVGGYVYFGQGVTIYMYGIYILIKFCQSKDKSIRGYYTALILITLFCMIKCYLLFLPVFLASIMVYGFYRMRGKIAKRSIVGMFIIAIVLIVIAFSMIYWGYFHGDFEYVYRSLRTEGFIFREVYKDFMFILPMNVYMWTTKYKKQQDLFSIFTMVHLIVTVAAVIVCLCGGLSAYYYFKLYYLGWMLQMIGTLQIVEYFWYEKRQVIWFCILPIVTVAFFELTGFNKVFERRRLDSGRTFPVMADSINYMKSSSDSTKERTSSLITVCIWINTQFAEEEVPVIVHNFMPLASWYGAITGNEWYSVEQGGFSEVLENLCESGSCYFMMIRDGDMFSDEKDIVDDCQIVYDDGFCTVYFKACN